MKSLWQNIKTSFNVVWFNIKDTFVLLMKPVRNRYSVGQYVPRDETLCNADDGATIQWRTLEPTNHRVYLGSDANRYDLLFTLTEVTKTPVFKLQYLVSVTNFTYLCESYDPFTRKWLSCFEGRFTTTGTGLARAPKKVRFV